MDHYQMSTYLRNVADAKYVHREWLARMIVTLRCNSSVF